MRMTQHRRDHVSAAPQTKCMEKEYCPTKAYLILDCLHREHQAQLVISIIPISPIVGSLSFLKIERLNIDNYSKTYIFCTNL